MKAKHNLGMVERPGRGFARIDFTDRYDHPCSVQQSSIATENCLWLGPTTADPKIMAADAAAHGVRTREMTGWVPYPVPDAVLLTTRMHLSEQQVRDLVSVLNHWLETGELDG